MSAKTIGTTDFSKAASFTTQEKVMTITLPGEAVEAAADEIRRRRFTHLTSSEIARAAITAALEQMVASGRAFENEMTSPDKPTIPVLIIRLDSDT